jgi:hypothetical protein
LDCVSENSMRLLLGCPIRLGCNPNSLDVYDSDENKELYRMILINNKLLFSKIGLHKILIK